MIKETIEYTDYAGNTRKEDFYFNLTETEAIKLEIVDDGSSLTEKINRIIDAKDIPEIIKVFDEFIDKAYGVKSADGREFEKSPELTRKFKSTEAYNKLYIKLIIEPGAAAAFVNGIIPKGLDKIVPAGATPNVVNA